MSGYEAIVQYGKERGWDFLRPLGLTTRWGLCKSTYSRVFRWIDVDDFEARVGRWIRGHVGPVDAKPNEHKAALEHVGVLSVKGRVVTGEVTFTHRDVCTAVIDGAGDYMAPVKENQPALCRDIAATFTEPGLSPPPPDRATRGRDRAGLRG